MYIMKLVRKVIFNQEELISCLRKKSNKVFFKHIKVSQSFVSLSSTQSFDHSLMKLVETHCTSSRSKIGEETNIQKLRLKER
jgi:hypothetical protein